MPHLDSLIRIEPSKKFVVDTIVNIVFCFGPRFRLKTEAGPS